MGSVNDTILNIFGTGNAFSSELRRMEEARGSWLKDLRSSYGMGSEFSKLTDAAKSSWVGENSASFHLFKQLQHQQELTRRMLDPIAGIRKHFKLDAGLSQLVRNIDSISQVDSNFARVYSETNQLTKVIEGLQHGMQLSLKHARESLATTSAASQINQLMKSFQSVHKHWEVPKELVQSVGAVNALYESIGRLTLPVIDWPSAATLAKLLGDHGIRAQLAALGIDDDGTLLEESLGSTEKEHGIGLSRRSLELMALLSFIAAFLIPYLQELSSDKWQGKTDTELATHRHLLDSQEKQLSALSKLVEKSILKDLRLASERFVVGDRVTSVRITPEHGSAILGKLLPREVVEPLAEKGKWLKVEYYDWLRQEYQTGWSLKKYFKRVPANYSSSNALEPKNAKSPLDSIGQQNKGFEVRADDETAYLMASPKNAERLNRAIESFEAGKAKRRELIEE